MNDTNENNATDVNRARTQHRRIISPAALVEEAPRSVKLSEWHNPSAHHLKFDLFIADAVRQHDGKNSLPTWCHCEVEPGGKVTIPSTFDSAIHQIDRGGRVIGGLAPQLRRINAPEPSFAPGIK